MIKSIGIKKANNLLINRLNVAISRQLNGLVIGVPKETLPGEARVALTPAHVIKLKKAGAKVRVQSGAGVLSGFQDASYKEAGAEIIDEPEVWKSQVVTKVKNKLIKY